jgi:hypothetical protein
VTVTQLFAVATLALVRRSVFDADLVCFGIEIDSRLFENGSTKGPDVFGTNGDEHFVLGLPPLLLIDNDSAVVVQVDADRRLFRDD